MEFPESAAGGSRLLLSPQVCLPAMTLHYANPKNSENEVCTRFN